MNYGPQANIIFFYYFMWFSFILLHIKQDKIVKHNCGYFISQVETSPIKTTYFVHSSSTLNDTAKLASNIQDTLHP